VAPESSVRRWEGKEKKNKNKKVCGRERIHEEMSLYQIDSTRMEAGEHVVTTTGW
jgi:hypothetical protein